MELIIYNDGTYSLVEVTKQMIDIIRLEFTEYLDYPINLHQMKDGSGYFYGCICR